VGDGLEPAEPQHLKILVIEDNPADVRLLQKKLAPWPFELESSTRLSSGLEKIEKGTFDLVLLDLSLPDSQGIETFYQLHCHAPQIPVIVLTGLEDESVGNEAVQLGAQDYLVKGQVLPGLLGRSIKYAIERHQTELKMKRLNDSLERRVIQLATANQELDKMGKALALSCEHALQASNFKSKFVARVSHDIRSPISAVMAITELLLLDKQGASEEVKRLIRLIDDSARSQLSLLNEILDFSKIEAGKVELSNVEFCPVGLLEDTAELFAVAAAGQGVSLITYIDSRLQPLLVGDPTLLREILTNLTNNAIKFTPVGNVVLRATKEAEDNNIVTVRFSVSDSGIGVSEAYRKNLFEPFVQAHDQTGKNFGGSGLGLSICRGLVELMGGQIGCESAEGKGSTFWFSLRLKRGTDRGASATEGSHRLNQYKKPVRVIIVDDNSVEREILQSYLEAAGWVTNGKAATATEALELLHHAEAMGEPYEVAIIDLDASTPNSFELARLIEQEPLLSSTRLVFLAKVDQRVKGEQAWSAGFSAYLTRPVKQWSLLDCITKIANGDAHDEVSADLNDIPAEHKVLVVEDNPIMRTLLVLQLKRFGIASDAVNNGLEAVDAVSKNQYSLILMDCQMPLMSGMEATIAIRQMTNSAGRTPIVAVSAGAAGQGMQECLEAGMNEYLKKPLSNEDLGALLKRWSMLAQAKGI